MAEALQPAQAAQWWDLLGKFREAGAKVDAMLQRLRAQEGTARTDAGLSARFDAVMARAVSIRASITSTLQTIEGALSALRGLVDWIPGLNGLGLAPVGVVAVAAALTAVTYWLADAYKLAADLDARAQGMARRQAEQLRLEAAGLTPQEAAAQVERALPVAAFAAGPDLAAQLIRPLAIGGALFLVWRFLQARKGH